MNKIQRGRPKKEEKTLKHHIKFRCDDRIMMMLTNMSKIEKRSISSIIRFAITHVYLYCGYNDDSRYKIL